MERYLLVYSDGSVEILKKVDETIIKAAEHGGIVSLLLVCSSAPFTVGLFSGDSTNLNRTEFWEDVEDKEIHIDNVLVGDVCSDPASISNLLTYLWGLAIH